MKHLFFAAAIVLSALPARAEMMVHDVTARLGIGDRPGVMFAMFHNKGAATQLVSASSPSFESIELHTHQHGENGMMRMVKVNGFSIAANGMLKLQPGGDHLMLFGYRGAVGDEVTVSVTFADGRTADLSAVTQVRQKRSHKRGQKPDDTSNGKMNIHGHHSGH